MKLPSFSQWRKFFKILSRKEKLAFFFLAFAAAASLAVLAASFYLGHTVEVAADNGTYVEGTVGSPRFLNPVYADSNSVDRDIAELLFSGLLEYGKDGNIAGGLADYKISDDAKTYEFTLKDGLKWSDGAPITSDDAIYTIKTIQDPAYKSPLRPQWIGVETEKVSETVFRLKLQNPYAAFLENCTLKIIPKHTWEKTSADNFPLSPLNLAPVVSGPYRVKKVNLAKDSSVSSIELERNPAGAGPKPHLAKITFEFFSDYDSLAAAVKRGRIQGFVPPTDVAAGQFSGTRIYSYSLPRYFAIFLNPENNKALADANVRAALAYATDKAEILKTALNNEGAAVDSPLPQNIYGLVAPDTVYGYDPQRAGKILDDAGYKIGTDGLRTKTIDRQPAFQFTKNLAKGSGPVTDVKELQKCLKREVAPDLDTNGNFGDKTLEAVKLFQEKYRADILDPQNIAQANGIVKQATRDKLNEVCFPSGDQTQALNIVLTVAGQPPFAGVAEIIKAQWAKIGVNVAIKTMDIGAFEQDAIKPRAYEAILFGEALGMIPDPYPFWHSSQKADPGLNFSLYENKDADKLLEEIRQTADQNARNEKLAAFQNLVARDEPAIFLYNPAYIYAVSDNVKGIQTHTISNPSQRFDGIADWYTATKRVWK